MFGRSKVVGQLKALGASLQQRNRFGISPKRMVVNTLTYASI